MHRPTDWRTDAGIALSLCVLLGIAILAYRTSRSLDATARWVLHTQEVLLNIEHAESDLKEAESDARGFVITGSDVFLNSYRPSVEKTSTDLDELARLTIDNATQQQRVASLRPVVKDRVASLDRMIALRRNDQALTAAEQTNTREGKNLMDRVSGTLAEMKVEEKTLLDARLTAARDDTQRTFTLLGVGIGLNFVLMVAVVFVMRRDSAARAQSADKLRKSAEEIRDLYDRAPCGYQTLDKDGVFIAINQTQLSWLGCTADEVIGKKKFSDFLTDDGKKRFQENYRQFIEIGSTRNREYDLVCKGGRILPVLLNADVVRDAHGNFVYGRASLVDITERKRLEWTIQQARVHAESIVNTVREPLLIFDTDLRVTSANRSYYDAFHTTPEETEGRLLRELLGGAWAVPELLHELERVVPDDKQLEDFEVSLHLPRAGRRVFELNARKLRRPGNHTTHTLLAIADVTERRRAALLHLQFRALFESLPGLYVVLTPDLTIVAVSDAYLKATMTAREKILGRPLFEIFPDNPDDAAADGVKNLRASLMRVIQGGVPDTMAIQRYDVRREDGTFEERYWSPVNSPVFDVDRKLEYIIHRVEDVTDFVLQKRNGALRQEEAERWRTRMEKMEAEVFARSRELETANQQLRTLNEELEAFSYSVSHDLRAPLRHIDGFADMLRAHVGDTLDPQGRRYLGTISDSARRMGQLIDDLLVFSRMGRAEMNRKKINLGNLVDEVRKFIQNEAEGREVQWEIGPLPEVEGDPAMIRQVVANLFSNALKYTRQKPSARIDVGALAARPGEHVVFVRDNGAGFDMKYAPKLFGVFQRLHSANEFEGTGVGLAIDKRILQRHGGRVWAEGRLNEGATFYFSLPLAPPPNATTASP